MAFLTLTQNYTVIWTQDICVSGWLNAVIRKTGRLPVPGSLPVFLGNINYFISELAFGLQDESFKGAQQFYGFGLKKNGMLSKYLKNW